MILIIIPAKYNPSSFYYTSLKKRYQNNYIINYKRTSYYKKSIKVLNLSESLPDYLDAKNKITFRRKKRVQSKLLAANWTLRKGIVKLFRAGKPLKLVKYSRLRKPIIRANVFGKSNPYFLLYSRLPAHSKPFYTFVRRYTPSIKSGKRLTRYLTNKSRINRFKRSKRFKRNNKRLNKSLPIIKHLRRPSQPQTKPSIKLKNVSYSFTLKNVPLFISYRFKNMTNRFRPFKANVKKLIFSFLKPNQIRRSLMLRRQKITYFRFFNRFNKKDLSTRFLITNYPRASQSFLFSNTRTLLFNDPRLRYYSYNKLSVASLTDNLFLQKFPNYESFKGEVHVPRVRFKPGYQRLWRESRRTLAESLRVRYIYQQQFTKFITKFGRKLNNYHFSRDEYTLASIILYSRLVPDYNTLLTLDKHSCVFANGCTKKDLNHILFPGDNVQLLVSNWMYIYMKWVLLWTNNRVKKFRKLVYRKNLAASYKVMKTRKQRSNYTPMWIHHTKYDISDIKPFLETDFFTMSSVLIYDNFLFDYYTPSWFIENRSMIYRLYNWKYIT